MMPTDWVPRSPDSSYASSPSNNNSGSGSGSPSPTRCEISLLERLIRTHPLWFLPSLQRSGALHLLQGREVGNFIVRSSREPDTMAVSVKLSGNQVEHYLLHKATEENRIALQDSEHSFPTVHQLIAHYCCFSDEIPVYLRVPNAISEATTRQELRSLALLGQEFWTISSSPPVTHRSGSCIASNTNNSTVVGQTNNGITEQGSPPPSDADSSHSHPLPSKSSGIGSQSSSSQNSLVDFGSKKPCRPTTLELGRSRTLLSFNGATPPLSVPNPPPSSRWLTPTPTTKTNTAFSQPSSVQSTPSEQISSCMSDRINFRSGHGHHHSRRLKKTSGGKSIHYKDTEIIDLFKGTKTVLDDKVSDYEDVWSNSNPHTPCTPSASRRLFTFKPDVIPLNTPTGDITQSQHNHLHHRHLNQSKSLSLCVTPTNANFSTIEDQDIFKQRGLYFPNINNRLSLKNININLLNSENETGMEDVNKKKKMSYENVISNRYTAHSNNKGIYSEPLDSVSSNNNCPRQTQTNNIQNRWSHQPSAPPHALLFESETLQQKANSNNNNNLRQKRYICGSKSSDNLNHVGIKEKYNNEENISVNHPQSISKLHASSSSWQVDNSWQFCRNQNIKTDSKQQRKKEEKRSEKENNLNNLKLKLGFGGNSSGGATNISSPLSPSPQNWENLLRLVTESSKQLESLQLNTCQENESSHTSSVMESSDNVSSASRSDSIRSIVEILAKKQNGVFGPMLKSFICCTLSGKLQDPFKVLRNIRQFISGMKNYLVGVSPESDMIHKEIKKQSGKLGPSEFLNVDLILEQILVDLVIQPLYHHVMTLLRKDNQKSDDHHHILASNSRNNQSTNQHQKLTRIYESFEESISPITKLDKWNEFVCEVQNLMNSSNTLDFFTLLTSSLRQVGSIDIDSQADYVIGLLPPCISERNGYSLSLLQSVVSALKSSTELDYTRYNSAAHQFQRSISTVKIIVPDERSGTLIRKVVPIRESMTSKEVAKLLSNKLGITNSSDYVLVTIRNGEERICQENDLIQQVMENEESSPALAYKRIDSKIGWPMKIT